MDDRLILAVGRLERAIARVEAGLRLLAESGTESHEVERLRAQNGLLKEAVKRSIARLDDLTASEAR